MSPDQRNRLLVNMLILLASFGVVAFTGTEFGKMREPDVIVPGEGVTEIRRLGEYFSALSGTPGDTDVYVLEGENPGGTYLLLGGVHANEPAGMLAAVTVLENAVVEEGTLIVIPQTNASAFTHNGAGHASPQFFEIETEWGARRFRYGDRLSNPLHQYPDPDVHTHYPSATFGSGQESRNLNRNFPGRPDGTLTEAIAFGVQQLILQEEVDLVLDLHEARPMNPIVNAVVAHERAADVAALALVDLEITEQVSMRLEITPERFYGVSQRELGAHTPALAVLSESANIAMDYVHGPISSDLVLNGRDEFLAQAVTRPGLVYIDYDLEEGLPIADRVGRHLAVFSGLGAVFNEFYPDSVITINGVPQHAEVVENGLGAYLARP